MKDDLNDFIKAKGLGIPTLKPDEKRAFLGNFKERVALAITVRQLHSEQVYAMLDAVLARYPQYRIYLNGRMSETFINTYMKLALAHDYRFTVMAQSGMRVDRRITADDFGFVLAHPTEKITRPILL